MAFRYEVTADSALCALFQARFYSVLEAVGFSRMFHLATPEAPRVFEFRRGEDLLSVVISPMGKGKERIAIDSETVDFQDFVTSAVRDTASEFLKTFLVPLTRGI